MCERSGIVLVVAKEEVFNYIRDALADTTLALLHAQTKHDALALLERLKSTMDLAIVELELHQRIFETDWRILPVSQQKE